LALIYISAAWIAGILLGSLFAPHSALIFIGLAPLLCLFFLPRWRKPIIVGAACLIAFLGGAMCYQSNLPPEDGSHVKSYNGQEVVIEGMVSADPEVGDSATQVRLSLSAIEPENGERRAVEGDVLLFLPRYPEYQYGDVLAVTGELEAPQSFGDFDYTGYLEHQGIYATMRFYRSADIEVLETGQGAKPLEWIYSFRHSLADSLERVMPEPQASLTQGVLLGIRENIPQDVKDDFARTGTAHLLAISGLHLSIMAGILLSVGIWLFGRRRFIYIWLALGVIWLYAIITGFNPPVVRGAIMASLFLSAELMGRQRTAVTSLALAAAVMVGLDPPIVFDAAFQLSFAAMAGLIFIAPPLIGLGQRVVKAGLKERSIANIANIVSDGLAVTLAAVIAVWPLIAYYFGVVSLVGPLATLLAAPALPFIIVLGAAAGILGLLLVPVAQAIGWVSWVFSSYMLVIAGGFAALPFSSVEVASISPAFIVVYYVALAIAIGLIRRRDWREKVKSWLGAGARGFCRLPWKWVVPPLAVLAVLVTAAAVAMPDDKLHVSFLDVGQGDAILVQRGHQQVLIDGGPNPRALALELGERMPFWDRTIELVVLTHPHEDHLGGLVEVLERYEVERVLHPDLEYGSALYDEWQALIEANDIPITVARAGQGVVLGDGATMAVLNPPATLLEGTNSDLNNNSAVLRLVMGEVSFLLTGDIELEAELGLIARGAGLGSTVLKVGHSGSLTSTSQDFLAAAAPEVAVISVGPNPYGHPHGGVVASLEESLGAANVYRTDELGTIEFITDGERLWVRADGS
jgi:competence protein ComEC